MNAEFNVWLLVVGLVVGAGLVWYVLMDARRREADVVGRERPMEAAWLSATLRSEGWEVPPEAAERLLELHRVYLDAPPPDGVGAADGQSSPTRAGSGSAPEPAGPASDTSNLDPAGSEVITGESPAQ